MTDPKSLGLPFASWTLDRLAAHLHEVKRIPMSRARIGKLLAADPIRELAVLKKARGEIAGVAVPVMAEQPANFARQTQIFGRGNWLDREAVVTPGVPEVMPPLPAGVPADRLAMAVEIPDLDQRRDRALDPDHALLKRLALLRQRWRCAQQRQRDDEQTGH